MKIAIGSDHAGFDLKVHLVAWLEEHSHEVIDLGTDSTEPVDYPPICASVARMVAKSEVDFGVVLGGSGQGEQIAANKVHGVRAALCNDVAMARLARQHNDANVIAMGGRIVSGPAACENLEVFLDTEFEGGRHVPRLEQISQIEREG